MQRELWNSLQKCFAVEGNNLESPAYLRGHCMGCNIEERVRRFFSSLQPGALGCPDLNTFHPCKLLFGTVM